MKAYILDILREIRKSFGRFFSILAIVALGTAFFAGVKASVPDMLYTADKYFKDQNMLDIRMISTIGFTKADVDAIKKVDGIEGIMPAHTMDFLTHKNTTQKVVKAISLPTTNKKDVNYINHVRLVKGRMPKQANECLVEEQGLKDFGYQIGDQITLESGSKEDIKKSLSQTTFTIVGSAYSPEYLSFNKGTSTIGSGNVDLFIMIDDSNFVSDYYSEVLVTVKDAKKFNSYDDEYFKHINPIVTALNQVGIQRSDLRYEEIKKLANQKYEAGLAKYQEAKKTFDTQIAQAKSKLETSKDQLLLAKATLESNKLNFTSTQTMLEMQIAQNEAMIKQYQAQLDEVLLLQKQANEKLNPLIQQYQQQKNDAQNKLIALQQQLNDPNLSETERIRIETEIQLLEKAINEYSKNIEEALQAKKTLDEKIAMFQKGINDGKQKITDGKNQLANAKIQATTQFAQAEAKIEQGQKQYVEGKVSFDKKQKQGQAELDLAKEQLEHSKQQLADLPQPNWYVLDRNSHYSYRDYESVTQRMEGIAKVFPLFFLLVCALVCLTTMTRMVDEQRGIIGTYKALGYSNTKIMMKYIIYALVAGVLGSILGCVLGMIIFPLVIFNAWNLMYNLPPLQFVLQLPLAISSSIAVIFVTLLATILACYKELKEVAASLMRPKPPKNGKSIFLERIPWLWKKFSFSYKVTARNIFRYKKRFFMTVIGVSGCSALLVAGFGIKDSIRDVVDQQYNEIMKYDAMLNFDTNSTYEQRDQVYETLAKDQDIKAFTPLMQKNGVVKVDGEDCNVSVVVPQDCIAFKEYVTLKNRKSQELLDFSNDGAIVSEKLTMNLHAKVGDVIAIRFNDDVVKEIKISAIMENYVGHVLYMSESYYKTLMNERAVDNAVFMKLKKVNEASERSVGNRYMSEDHVSSMAFYDGVAKRFEDTISSLNFVIYVLIAAAGLLAFVVLYNLTNVNISERIREIATIKVLGFYPKEVASYVYRENILLTLIGGLCGLVLGIVLHALIMNLAEMPEIMFGRNIDAISFILSIILTLLFAMIVNVVMYRKLQGVEMVESLKSVE